MLSLYLSLNSVQILSRLLRIVHLRMPHTKLQPFKTPKAMSVVQAYTRNLSFSLVLNIHLHVLDCNSLFCQQWEYCNVTDLLNSCNGTDLFKLKKRKACVLLACSVHPAVLLLHAVSCDLRNYSFLIFIHFPNYKQHTSVIWK